MNKVCLTLLALAFLIPFGCMAAEHRGNKTTSSQHLEVDDHEEENEDTIAASDSDDVKSSNPRWYKEKEGRREYLRGGQNYHRYQGQSLNSNDDHSPTSDSRWVKDPAARKEYLKGGTDYPKQ